MYAGHDQPMSVLAPRNRIVYFRLSQDEFKKLNAMCQDADGARSVSELSRLAVQRLVNGENGSENNAAVLGRLDRTIADLDWKLDQLLHLVQTVLLRQKKENWQQNPQEQPLTDAKCPGEHEPCGD